MNATANGNWKYHGPYVGTGFDLGLGGGFKMYMDLGVVFTSKAAQLGLNVPTEGLKTGDDQVVQGNATLEANLQNDIDATLQEGQDELDKYKYFPIVKIGFMYRF